MTQVLSSARAFSIAELPGVPHLSTFIMNTDFSSSGNDRMRPYWMTFLQETTSNLNLNPKAGIRDTLMGRTHLGEGSRGAI